MLCYLDVRLNDVVLKLYNNLRLFQIVSSSSLVDIPKRCL